MTWFLSTCCGRNKTENIQLSPFAISCRFRRYGTAVAAAIWKCERLNIQQIRCLCVCEWRREEKRKWNGFLATENLLNKKKNKSKSDETHPCRENVEQQKKNSVEACVGQCAVAIIPAKNGVQVEMTEFSIILTAVSKVMWLSIIVTANGLAHKCANVYVCGVFLCQWPRSIEPTVRPHVFHIYLRQTYLLSLYITRYVVESKQVWWHVCPLRNTSVLLAIRLLAVSVSVYVRGLHLSVAIARRHSSSSSSEP